MKDRINEAYRYLIYQGLVSSQLDVSIAMGINKATVSLIMNGNKKYLTKSFIKKFCHTFHDFNDHWLLTGEGEMLKSETTIQNTNTASKEQKIANLNALIADIQQNGKKREKIHFLPLMNIDVVGGSNNDVRDATEYIEEIIPVSGARQDSILVPVSGDSMMPVFFPGDIVIIDEVIDWTLFLEMGQYYVIALKDNRRLIKKITYSEEDRKQQLLLVSENPKYPPVEIYKSLIHKVFIVTQKHQKLTL